MLRCVSHYENAKRKKYLDEICIFSYWSSVVVLAALFVQDLVRPLDQINTSCPLLVVSHSYVLAKCVLVAFELFYCYDVNF